MISSFFRSIFTGKPSLAMTEAAKTKAQQLIDDNAVMVFSKSYCPYCTATKRKLTDLSAKFNAIELDQMADGGDIQDALEGMTGQRSVPNIFIAKKHIGGNSDLQALKDLAILLKDAGALEHGRGGGPSL
ncbi:hypothetical protein RB595_008240 [Gaeumannomyces hyphopodioides]